MGRAKPSAVVAAMLYEPPEYAPEREAYERLQLLLVRQFDRVQVLHFGHEALFVGHVKRVLSAPDAETHRQSLLRTNTVAELLAVVTPERSVEWKHVRRVRFDRAIATVWGRDGEELRLHVSDAEALADWFRGHLADFATAASRRTARQILGDAAVLGVAATALAALLVALGNLIAQVGWLTGVGRGVIDGGGSLLALCLPLILLSTIVRLRRRETVMELRPREARSAYR